MLKIEKLKDLILNYDIENCEDDFNCYLSRIATNSNDNKNICRVVTCSECVRLSLDEWIVASDDCRGILDSLLNFVKWEDEEPWNIDNILANCEVIEDEKS